MGLHGRPGRDGIPQLGIGDGVDDLDVGVQQLLDGRPHPVRHGRVRLGRRVDAPPHQGPDAPGGGDGREAAGCARNAEDEAGRPLRQERRAGKLGGADDGQHVVVLARDLAGRGAGGNQLTGNVEYSRESTLGRVSCALLVSGTAKRARLLVWKSRVGSHAPPERQLAGMAAQILLQMLATCTAWTFVG